MKEAEAVKKYAGLCVGLLLLLSGVLLRGQSHPTPLAQTPSLPPTNEYHEVRWSPDGKSLAVVMRTSAKAPFRIAIIPADGGELRWLTSESRSATSPRWSPDGRQIAFLSSRGPISEPIDLFVAATDGRDVHSIASAPFMQFNLGYTWTSDGLGFNYFALYPRAERGHYTMDLGGHASLTPGTESIQDMITIEWSADRSRVAFTTGKPSRLFVAAAHGENPTAITGSADREVHCPAWAPDGKTLTYCLYQRPTSGPTLWTIGLNRTADRSVAADGIGGQFSPDGQWIAYVDGRISSSYKRVCKARPDGSGVVVLAR